MQNNNFDVVKYGVGWLFLNGVCNGNNITIDTIEPELNKIDKMNLRDSSDIIENSKFLNLVCEILNNFEINLNNFFPVFDFQKLEEAFSEFEIEFYNYYGFEPL